MLAGDGQYRIRFPAGGGHDGADLTWGSKASGILNIEVPDLLPDFGDPGDTPPPLQDGVRFGRDYVGTSALAFSFGVTSFDAKSGGRHALNIDRMSDLAHAWHAKAIRQQPRAVAELSFQVAGRQRLLFGRPRSFGPARGTFARHGYHPAVGQFKLAEDRAYSVTEFNQQVGMSLAASGYGLKSPLSTPLAAVPFGATVIPAAVVNSGNTSTWLTPTIRGPIVNPKVTLVGHWSVQLIGSIPANRSVTIDPRPWVQTIIQSSNGASWAGQVTPASVRLDQMLAPPGSHQFRLEGADPTGTATLFVRWRDAYRYP